MKRTLVGRGDDLTRLQELVSSGRCVSVIGPPGLGKSAVVAQFVRSWTGEVVTIDLHDGGGSAVLVSLADAPHAPGTLIVLDGLTGPDSEERQAISVLVASGCAVLATGRDLMGVSGESVLPLAPLRSRGAGDESGELPALALLEQCVVEAGGDVADRAVAEALVDLLDGVPGAIELAASHVPTAGLDSVLTGLRARFGEKERRGERVVRSIILELVLEWEATAA